ncbi:MAG: hypothetical protein HQK64_14230 [Desulfamplus sp.]|nr:hypothetical protein [Desulfamplus sp.]
MKVLKRETEYLEQFQDDFIGIKPHPDIIHIPTGYIGDYEVKVDYNIDMASEANCYRYESLYYKKNVIADNNPKHLYKRHQWLIDNAYGDVLVFGLGLGDSLNLLMKKWRAKAVRSILVIEKYQEIIALVAPYFTKNNISDSVCIMQGDIYSLNTLIKSFDVIYHAIWNSPPDQDEINTISNKYKKYCTKQGFIYQK